MLTEVYWNCNSYAMLVTLKNTCQEPHIHLLAHSPSPQKCPEDPTNPGSENPT